MATASSPKTLREAILFFADYQQCRQAVEAIRWPDGVVRCPTCGSEKITYLENARVYKCYGKHPRAKFSLKVGTIFEDSAVGLEKWLPALWLLTNCKNGISSYELARALGVTQKTAWFMLSRLRLALQAEDGGKMGGHVEVDETFIGGKARNMHRSKRDRVIRGTGGMGKVAVMGLLSRHGKDGHSTVRVSVVENRRKAALQTKVRENVRRGAKIYTDELLSYDGLPSDYVDNVIIHAQRYVDGQVYTNGCEDFWSLLKRSLKGTYVSVEPFHLFRYLNEQSFRFNLRKLSDAARFAIGLAGVLGKRLSYTGLTGSELPETC